MAKVQGAEIVWTSADMAALLQDKARLQEIIDQIPSNPAAESRTEFSFKRSGLRTTRTRTVQSSFMSATCTI